MVRKSCQKPPGIAHGEARQCHRLPVLLAVWRNPPTGCPLHAPRRAAQLQSALQYGEGVGWMGGWGPGGGKGQPVS